jgi:hypothetical protein
MNGISELPFDQICDDVDFSSDDTNKHKDSPSESFAIRGAMHFAEQ